MLDNFQPIPGEAFTATGSLCEKILEKCSNAIGWAVIPRNTKKYRLEAEEYLIEQIKKDEKIPPLAKAAYISNARKMIKQYVNKCDIFTQAMDCMPQEVSIENVDAVDDDFLNYFFNKAEDIERDDMKIIWSKLLAREFEKPHSVSKQLVHILTVISYDDALSFAKLSSYCADIDNVDVPIIYLGKYSDFYKENGFREQEMFNLADIGLVQCSAVGYEQELEDYEKIKYFGNEIDIGDAKKIRTGNVILSKSGEELMSILTERTRIDGYDKILAENLISQ